MSVRSDRLSCMSSNPSMREQILKAALECMRVGGVRGTTTQANARYAGAGEVSINHNFTNLSERSMEAIVHATSGSRQRSMGMAALVGRNSVEENLSDLLVDVTAFLREITPIAGSVMGDPDLKAWFARGQKPQSHDEDLTPLTGVVEIAEYLEAEHVGGRIAQEKPWEVCASMLIGSSLHYVYTEALSTTGMPGLLKNNDRSVRGFARSVVTSLLDVN